MLQREPYEQMGQGVGEYAWQESHVSVLQHGIELGMNLLDTAEGYAKGVSEEIVGKAIQGRRNQVLVATKFSPERKSFNDIRIALEGSLTRLGTDYVDIYQMHWPNPAAHQEDIALAMLNLVNGGKVRWLGVCNVSPKELLMWIDYLGDNLKFVQMEYNLFDRTAEENIFPICQANDLTLLAYSPLDKGRVLDGVGRCQALTEISKKYGRTISQVALNYLMQTPFVVPIPKTYSLEHLESNFEAALFDLSKEDIAEIDKISQRGVVNVTPTNIFVSPYGEGNVVTYQDMHQAVQNSLNFVPSPGEVAKGLLQDAHIKPVRLVLREDGKYILVEGRIRYWAWIFAFGDTAIPALVREGFKENRNE